MKEVTADQMARIIAKPYHGRKVGERVTISTEEPLYDFDGKRIDGQKGRITKLIPGSTHAVQIKLDDSRTVKIGVGLLRAPDSWFDQSSESKRKYAEKLFGKKALRKADERMAARAYADDDRGWK